MNLISVVCIPQLNDNYSFAIINNSNVIIVDPAEDTSIIKYIKKNNLILKAILITHHHNDHTAGIKGILNYRKVDVYSPNKKINGTSKIIKDGDLIDLNFIEIEVISTPGHTLDHIIFYNKINKILFSGDTLFRFGCGRIFEGTNEQMFQSIKKIHSLDDGTIVYCGHEYTLNNLNFLISAFPDNLDLIYEKTKIERQLSMNGRSIPFRLDEEKKLNPFLSTKSKAFNVFKNEKNFTDIEIFSYLRDLKNKF